MKIGIIGCGWLGKPLAEKLVSLGYEVVGSTTTASKLEGLKNLGIKPVLFKLTPMPEGEDFNLLFQVETLFINIPPQSRTQKPEFYREQIKYLKYALSSSKVKKVIFISSTSYYPNTNSEVTEQTIFDLENGSNQAVVWAEQEISQIKQKLSILRCGGLMGNGRIPGKWFAGKQVNGKENVVNYIHLNDVIEEVIGLFAENGAWPKVKNLVNQEEATKETIYSEMAAKYGFEKPIFDAPHASPHKIVKSKLPQRKYKELFSY